MNVLIVCDGGLNFGTGDFGLSEFLTAFNQLEATTLVDYRLTLAHRSSPNMIQSPNPVVVNHLSSFKFTDVNLDGFDQIWLFGILPAGTSMPLEIQEKNALEAYMNGGGGLFATGDHGVLGNDMCGDIVRVRDMRYWSSPPDTSGNTDSMSGRFRNDTNRPAAGDATSVWFDNQSDEIPQTIGVRTFGGGLPHPLLSISPRLRASGMIDVMPDHPHEGECKPETSFTVNGVTIPTQNIATSFVLGGSTTRGGGVSSKQLTVPHSFPSIAVWDGRPANVGRIVVDSTWHHFVNINLNGVGSTIDRPGLQPGLQPADFIAIRQYFMNIATWMTRRKFLLCWRPWVLFDLFRNSQIIEANLDRPNLSKNEISLAELGNIGGLAEEILASKFNPAFARTFFLDLIEDYNQELAEMLNVWKPEHVGKSKKTRAKDEYYQNWINLDLMFHTAIGAGFVALRDDNLISSEETDEKALTNLAEVFIKGMDYGFARSGENFRQSLDAFNSLFRKRR